MVVHNRPGGATVIGTDLVAKSPPDGYRLLVVSFAFAVNPNLTKQMATWAKVVKDAGVHID